MMKLSHRTVYFDKDLIKNGMYFDYNVNDNDNNENDDNSYNDNLRLLYHDNGEGIFPISTNPDIEKRSNIIGMFVLRSSSYEWNTEWSDNGNDFIQSMYDVTDWTYNYESLDGGWLLANGNCVDAYRLCLQYGLADAVLISTNNLSKEGVGSSAYMWQPYFVSKWPHLHNCDNNLDEKIMKLRRKFQKDGKLSHRKYPAQIVFSYSGKKHSNANDFLEGRIFNDDHPNENGELGDKIEVYIITSNNGAKEIIDRIHNKYHHLINRIENMIIPFSKHNDDNSIDIENIPSMLYSRLGMRIVNHDGGRQILNDFLKAGALSQMNLTLGKQSSLKTIINKRNENDNNIFDEKNCQYFFSPNGNSSDNNNNDNNSNNNSSINNNIPNSLKPFQIILDDLNEAAIVCFNTNVTNLSL